MARIFNGLGYREWQRRNSDRFKQLSRKEQKHSRAKGYRNVGWEKVRKSWELIRPSDPDVVDTPKAVDEATAVSVALQMYAALGDLREKFNIDEFDRLWDEGKQAEAFALARAELKAFKQRSKQRQDRNEAAFRQLRKLDTRMQQALEDDI